MRSGARRKLVQIQLGFAFRLEYFSLLKRGTLLCVIFLVTAVHLLYVESPLL